MLQEGAVKHPEVDPMILMGVTMMTMLVAIAVCVLMAVVDLENNAALFPLVVSGLP